MGDAQDTLLQDTLLDVETEVELASPHLASTTRPGVGCYATVILDRNQAPFDKELTYLVPPVLRSMLRPGYAVLVPFGRQTLTGYVTGFTGEVDFDEKQLRPILQLISKAPVFDAKALKVARWMSAYYHCPLGECLACYVPNGWQLAMERHYALADADSYLALRSVARAPRQYQIVQVMRKIAQPLTQREIERALGVAGVDLKDTRHVGETLRKLMELGVVVAEDELLEPVVKPRLVQAVRLTRPVTLEGEQWVALEKKAPQQAAALRQLCALAAPPPDGTEASPVIGEPIPTTRLVHDYGLATDALRGLEKKGYVEFTRLEQRRAPVPHMPPNDVGRVQLTPEQRAAVATIEKTLDAADDARQQAKAEAHDSGSPLTTYHSLPLTILLQGVTASGKTEVYLHAIERCIALGRRALVLVPEIALTAQTVEVFQRRFQERVAILHSAMSAGERFDEWRRVRSGRADIIVGARSAVFAPCRDIGLIIIDEEHDHSYKQDAMPRYHARDVALKRAVLENAVLVLGSATPSLESYQHALRGDYQHVKMTQRIGTRRLPEVEIVDMTDEAKMGTLPVLSQRLKDALCETVGRGEQAIIFLNRRGYATYVQCLGCGHVERCPNCDVTLTYHRRAQSLRCHHCDHGAPVLEECPECKGWMIGFTGTGTEKVESEVTALLEARGLTDAAVLRLDRDTTTHKGAHGKILGEFRQGRAQVLIGTQMVTKGLDFPNVTLVGVIAADTALNVPDFRAAERTFQLLAQVAGRAGRGDQPGRVLIQTLATDHYAIEAARTQDYEKFVRQEIELRKVPPYPPFSYVVNIIAHDPDAAIAQQRIQTLALQFQGAIEREGGATELLGPVDCPLSRVKNKYRFHLMLRDRSRPRLHRVLGVYDRLSREAREGLTIDVDAMTIM